MGNLSSFQHQKLRPTNTVQSSFAPQVRPSIPVPSPFPATTPPNEQASLEHARRFQGIERMSIFPREQNATPLAYGRQRTTDAVQRKRSFTKQMMQRQGKDEIQEQPVPLKKNMTGLPDTLKAGVEHLSGLSLDDVHVHYNSPKPAQLDALAYTQGTEIHVGPGQERHLAHEAWHVVQQKQGRVKPTLQMKGVKINDDQGLEKEADRIGNKILNTTSQFGTVKSILKIPFGKNVMTPYLYNHSGVIQTMPPRRRQPQRTAARRQWGSTSMRGRQQIRRTVMPIHIQGLGNRLRAEYRHAGGNPRDLQLTVRSFSRWK